LAPVLAVGAPWAPVAALAAVDAAGATWATGAPNVAVLSENGGLDVSCNRPLVRKQSSIEFVFGVGGRNEECGQHDKPSKAA